MSLISLFRAQEESQSLKSEEKYQEIEDRFKEQEERVLLKLRETVIMYKQNY